VIHYSADWLLPISASPIAGGAVTVDDGRIVAVEATAPADSVRLGRAAILPGLVNAHTHLELSYLRGRIPSAPTFIDWVRPMLAARRERSLLDDSTIAIAAQRALDEARACGTAVVGDVTNTLAVVPLLRERGVPAAVFYELLGFNVDNPQPQVTVARTAISALPDHPDLRLSLAPHAPYSVSPALFTAIRTDLDTHRPAVSTVHLGESREEVEFLRKGAGPWRTLLEELRVWNEQWEAPRASPTEYLADIGFLDSSVLVVHGVQFDGTDLARLHTLRSTIVSCPRSNQYVGVGAPPLEAFYAMDVEVAFGTDSLASVADLSLFAELAEARRIAPKVPARSLLRSATLTGARALGFDAEFGSIEPGKRAALIAVRLPERVSDVEEYLVSGVAPSAIRWLT
jgi:cytosine/adenosine deaminase-related metal-dependent hydrolase